MLRASPNRLPGLMPRLILAAFAALFALVPLAAAQQAVGQVTGFPLPRFVSLKSDRVNVRQGPGEQYPIAWIFTRVDLPVEVTQEYDNWRRIRDSDGAEGWVFQSLLAGKRTAVVAPWGTEPVELHRDPAESAAVVALLAPTVLSEIRECQDDWCRIRGDRFDGWIRQDLLWGVYPGEVIDP